MAGYESALKVQGMLRAAIRRPVFWILTTWIVFMALVIYSATMVPGIYCQGTPAVCVERIPVLTPAALDNLFVALLYLTVEYFGILGIIYALDRRAFRGKKQ